MKKCLGGEKVNLCSLLEGIVMSKYIQSDVFFEKYDKFTKVGKIYIEGSIPNLGDIQIVKESNEADIKYYIDINAYNKGPIGGDSDVIPNCIRLLINSKEVFELKLVRISASTVETNSNNGNYSTTDYHIVAPLDESLIKKLADAERLEMQVAYPNGKKSVEVETRKLHMLFKLFYYGVVVVDIDSFNKVLNSYNAAKNGGCKAVLVTAGVLFILFLIVMVAMVFN